MYEIENPNADYEFEKYFIIGEDESAYIKIFPADTGYNRHEGGAISVKVRYEKVWVKDTREEVMQGNLHYDFGKDEVRITVKDRYQFNRKQKYYSKIFSQHCITVFEKTMEVSKALAVDKDMYHMNRLIKIVEDYYNGL